MAGRGYPLSADKQRPAVFSLSWQEYVPASLLYAQWAGLYTKKMWKVANATEKLKIRAWQAMKIQKSFTNKTWISRLNRNLLKGCALPRRTEIINQIINSQNFPIKNLIFCRIFRPCRVAFVMQYIFHMWSCSFKNCTTLSTEPFMKTEEC